MIVPGVSLTEASERNLARLRLALRRSQTFGLFLVLADGPARAEVHARLRAWSGAEGLPALHFFPEGVTGSRAVLDALSVTGTAPLPGAVIVDGDTLLEQQTPIHALNVARDVLSRVVSGPLVMLLAPHREAELARLAPDLFDVRRASYEVEAAEPRTAQTIVAPISTAREVHEKLDPRLAALVELDHHVFESAEPAPLSALRPNGDGDRAHRDRGVSFSSVLVFVTARSAEDLDSIAHRAGVPLWRCRAGSIATADLSMHQLLEMERHEGLLAIEWTGGALPQARPAGPARRRHGVAPRSAVGLGEGAARADGSGVVIGVVDVDGLDIYHPAFVTADGMSRVVSLWDQTATRVTGDLGVVPKPYGYGVAYTRQDLYAELDPHSRERYAHVGHVALKASHGTMGAGVAAGGDVGDPSAHGVAPGADIVFVNTLASGAGSLAAMTELAEAVDFVFRAAGDKPCVVNMGIGDVLGPRDGTSAAERFFDALLTEKPGRALVIAAGNSNASGTHLAGAVEDTRAPFRFSCRVDRPHHWSAVIEVWYDEVARTDSGLALQLTSPDGALATPVIAADGLPRAFDLGETRFVVASVKRYPTSSNALIRIEMFPRRADGQIPAGDHRITLFGDGKPRPFHAWLDHPFFKLHAESVSAGAPAPVTLTSPGTCTSAVTVGACDLNGEPFYFSGCGPGRHGVDKPDVLAFGGSLRAPSAMTTHPYHPVFSGTSAAAALVTGAVALAFQHALQRGRHLTPQETRAFVRAAATRARTEHGSGRAQGHRPGRLTLPADGDLDALFAAAGISLPPQRPRAQLESTAEAEPESEPPSSRPPPSTATLRILESSPEPPPHATLADAWLRHAMMAADDQDWDRAMDASTEAIRLARAIGYHDAVASALRVQARGLAAAGRSKEAERAAREALATATAHLGDTARAAALDTLASILEAEGAVADALRIRQREQLPLLERLGDTRGRVAAMRKVASLHEALGEIDRALHVLQQEVVPAFEKLGDRGEAAAAVRKIAELREARGEVDEGLLQRIAAERASSPFPGLEPYDEERAQNFFGREAEVAEALGKVAESHARSRWLQIEGPSGVGKSSLARAGIVPAVRAGKLVEGPMAWTTVVMRPGRDPVANLAEALVERARPRLVLNGRGLEDIRTSLTASRTALAALLREARPDGHGVLLLVDQLDEAFTLARTDQDTVRQFDALVAAALDDGDVPLLLVTTMRSDFVARIGELPELGARFTAGAARYDLEPMPEDRMRAAIVSASARARIEHERGLVNRIVADAASSESALPLVAHVLQALYATRDGQKMTVRAYERLGGVGGVLVKGADTTLYGLSTDERHQVRRILLRLVKVVRGAEDTRQAVSREDALAAAGGGPDAERVLVRLSGGRLHGEEGAHEATVRLVAVSGQAAGERVTLTHDALVRKWNTLRAWIDEARPMLELREDVEESARIWSASGAHEESLPTGALLKYLRAVDRSTLRALARGYLDAAEEVERRAEERRAPEPEKQEAERQRSR